MPSTGLTSEKICIRELRSFILSFLGRCGMSYPIVEYDHDFDALCREVAICRGYPMEGPKSFARFLPGGVVMSTTAYAHLKSKSTQVFIALYTAFLIYIDDVFQHNNDIVRDFNAKFMLQQPQEDLMLDFFAKLLLESPKHFSKVGSNLITTSTLNLVTAMSLEYETLGMTIPAIAHAYPEFARVLSGATEAYAIFAFPPELPVPTFIQAIPEMMSYINYANDILSFHKEELAGETINYVSLLMKQRRLTKKESLGYVADASVGAHTRTLEILKPHKGALDAYKCFAVGYVGFHAGLPRYRLKDLGLELSA